MIKEMKVMEKRRKSPSSTSPPSAELVAVFSEDDLKALALLEAELDHHYTEERKQIMDAMNRKNPRDGDDLRKRVSVFILTAEDICTRA